MAAKAGKDLGFSILLDYYGMGVLTVFVFYFFRWPKLPKIMA